MILSSCTHSPVKTMTSFIFTDGHVWHIFLSRLSVDNHLGYFHFLATVARTVMNMAKQGSAEDDIDAFEHMPRNVETGSGYFIQIYLETRNLLVLHPNV